MKHTKGPWTVENGKFFIKITSGNQVVLASQNQGTTDEDRANANLIAAAPEMLEALEELTHRLTELNGEGKLAGLKLDKLIREAFDATEKAKGE